MHKYYTVCTKSFRLAWLAPLGRVGGAPDDVGLVPLHPLAKLLPSQFPGRPFRRLELSQITTREERPVPLLQGQDPMAALPAIPELYEVVAQFCQGQRLAGFRPLLPARQPAGL
ncbi:MAG: hypothetical protein WCL04_08920 [Verrucomicrobiota bacterium]